MEKCVDIVQIPAKPHNIMKVRAKSQDWVSWDKYLPSNECRRMVKYRLTFLLTSCASAASGHECNIA